MRRMRCRVVASCLLVAGAAGGADAQEVRAIVCPATDRPPRELAALVEPLGEAGRAALLTLASARGEDAVCGLAGLAAVRDARVVPLLISAVDAAPADTNVWRLVRWAGFIAGGPDPAVGAPLSALVPRLEAPAARAAAGDDGLRLLGELGTPAAREHLVATLDRRLSDAAVDAAVHALARQQEPSARARVSALGAEVAASLGGNATYEQARRLGAAAFYLLVLGADTQREGLALLARLSPQDQADTAAWAMQTLCERGVRRPAQRVDATGRREALADAFGAAGVVWQSLVRGAFPCPSRD